MAYETYVLINLREALLKCRGPSKEIDTRLWSYLVGSQNHYLCHDEVAQHPTHSIDSAVRMTEIVLPDWFWRLSYPTLAEVYHPNTPGSSRAGIGATVGHALIYAVLTVLIDQQKEK